MRDTLSTAAELVGVVVTLVALLALDVLAGVAFLGVLVAVVGYLLGEP